MSQLEKFTAKTLADDWESNPRWKGIKRDYSAQEVMDLRPSLLPEHTLANHTAKKFWESLVGPDFLRALGTLTGAQAVNMVKGGLKSLYVSGWQVAADANLSYNTYPDQGLYPINSVPTLVKRINSALMKADQTHKIDANAIKYDWYPPIVADAEAGFGGPLHAFELMKMMIEAGAAGVHFEDQLASEKKCGHLGGKVLVPTAQFQRVLSAARLASDVCNVPTLLIARTDALGAELITSDIDPYDREFLTGERTHEGHFRIRSGLESAIHRGLGYAPYADMLWFETSTPDIKEAQRFAEEIHKKFPEKLLSYNCSPSFNWEKNLNEKSIASFQNDLAALGYKFQFITLAGWHSVNYHSFDLAKGYNKKGMPAYVKLQRKEFESADQGYTAVKHQTEVGTQYHDKIVMAVSGKNASTLALSGSTESEQF